MPHNDSPYRKRGNESDFAVAMLRNLLDENHDLLGGKTGGLRCFIHDMAMHSRAIDNVLNMRVLPVVKTPKLKGGKYRHGNLGPHSFTPLNGPPTRLNIMTVNGSMWVALPDSQGTEWAVPLRRQHLFGAPQARSAPSRTSQPRSQRTPRSNISGELPPRCGSTAPPRRSTSSHTPAAPGHFAPSPKPTPTSRSTAPAKIESGFSDFKRRTNNKLCSIYEDNYRFNVLAYMILRLSRTRVAYRKRTATAVTQAVPIAA